MKKAILSLLFLFITGVAISQTTQQTTSQKVQLAILLDTSNSMDGLIEQTKSQLWKMVNELTRAKDNEGNTPQLEIALYEYGNDRLKRAEGYIRQVSPLTTDLDLISEKLFELTTYGGQEYCGQVIQNAIDSLEWSNQNSDMRIIFIAGNESFKQGKWDYQKACFRAKNKDVMINTVFCGEMEEGINIKWKSGADLGNGYYLNINQNETVSHIDAPQDKEILRLNNALNDTYIYYGERGVFYKERQVIQDTNASTYGAANQAQRVISKASSNYKNAIWDLVDAVEEGRVKLEDVATKDLPEIMHAMTLDQRRDYISEMKTKRETIKSQIQKLDVARRSFVEQKRKEMRAELGKETLDEVIIQTIRKQAIAKGFVFSE